MLSRKQLANALRILSIDAVQAANSGHPGMPLGMADIAEVLWNDFLRHNPQNPRWPNRDRFILSNGHGSMLQYALLHLTGYDLSLDDLKQFRQLHSKTPGHPEFGITPGVETTTGPLGQGLANGVGMAIAERHLAARFNRPGFPIIDHFTYVFTGDGCLMEGISHEVCSLAGTLGLGKLIVFWDDNGISIDGNVQGWFTEDIPKRFVAYGWQVIPQVDGHDPLAIKAAIEEAQRMSDRPTLICCQTLIGYGAPHVAGSHKVHGTPLGAEEVRATRQQLEWEYAPFVIPQEYYLQWDARTVGAQREAEWQTLFLAYQKQYPELAAEFTRRFNQELPKDWTAKTTAYIQATIQENRALATRKLSQQTLEVYAPLLPELIGGSADLTDSNLTRWAKAQTLHADTPEGNYLHYGVREFGMSAIMNGMALYGGLIPFGGTFLTFVDYARNAVRLAALMQQRVIFVYTHDSIGLGEDGPTHQPIEHINMLRMTPNLSVWRPCNAVETAIAWQVAIEQVNKPTCLLFSRQSFPAIPAPSDWRKVYQGGYILRDYATDPKLILIATGSEVALALAAAEQLAAQNIAVRVVSMPSTDTFAQQPVAYQQQVLPPHITARIAIEAGSSAFWYSYVGLRGKIIGIDRFGESAPAHDSYQSLGITVENILRAAQQLLTEVIYDN